MNFDNVYWDWDSMKNDNHFPSILAIGDSWFWYPFPGGSLANQLGPLIKDNQHFVLALGNNGAEAYDYVHGKYSKAVRTALKHHGSALSSVFISGGGNDFAGFSDLRRLLKFDCSAAQTADECFKGGNQEGTVNWLIKKTGDSYQALIGRILSSTNTQATVVLHNYDYALPSGKGLFGRNSSWLKSALDDARVPDTLQQACITLLLDRLTAELQKLTRIDPARIFLVDSTNTLNESDWQNEIHPKPAGFKKIAEQRWLPVFQNIGLA